ncbi:hypothetical protein [Stutzerimonas stutzeri]|uniref:hypothetical protein n=1 Tax=Stutzerimonas stutzeri TaxID=316 RepID=UPI00265CDB87|nr:hypothetical protein [Stutzerimonas stutzeri]MCF6783362.1 hypothetical protein [Stutzerimonas stutzeri]
MFTNEGRELYPKVAAAYDARRAAETALKEAMAKQFPKDARVLVIHHRGSYEGVVVSTDDVRVYVRNEVTGKTTGRYPLIDTGGLPSVQLLG